MFRVIALIATLLMSIHVNAADQTRYISDNIFIYTHAGPGTQYRITGSIEAGQAVKFLNETRADYSKIVDNKGRVGWIKSQNLSDNASFRILVPKLQETLNATQTKLTKAQKLNKNNAIELEKLNSQLASLKQRLLNTTQERDNAKSALKNIVDDQDYEKWQQGGLIAIIGLFIGLVIAYLPRPQRRNKERWM